MTSCASKWKKKALALSWIAGCAVRDGSKAVGNKYPITATRENSFLFLSLSLRASLFNHGCGAPLSYYTRYSCALTATLKGWGMKTGRPVKEETEKKKEEKTHLKRSPFFRCVSPQVESGQPRWPRRSWESTATWTAPKPNGTLENITRIRRTEQFLRTQPRKDTTR